MQTERKDLENQVEMKVTVPRERVDKALAQATDRLGKDALIPGFRRGKAPPNVVKAFLGKEKIREEALSSLLEETLEEIYQKENLTPLFSPQIKVEQFEEGMPFIFSLTVDPWPEFELPPVEQVKLDLPPPIVTDEDVEKTLFRLRESFATLTQKEGPAESGDVLVIKWRLGEEPWNTQMVELGKEAFLPDFDRNLVGLKAGDSKIAPLELRGEKAEIEIQVVEVKKKEIPPEDDEFAKNFQLSSIEELKEKVKSDLKNYTENEYQKKLKEEFINKYIELIPLEFSERAKNKALENYVDSFKDYLRSSGRTLNDFLRDIGLTEEEWRETVARKQALQTLKEQIVLWKVADERGIEIQEQELREALSEREDADPESVYGSLRRRKALDELFHDWQVSLILSKEKPEEGGEN
ncbi:MAG: trigger factor [Caldiserica bacterium]|nr:trigger factor [Caldisericota bacterium]MDH7562623.1 trigger factor [Caldisericota bacterium]